jgi:5-(carboxyamino)imidazole ribonucleotide synthase
LRPGPEALAHAQDKVQMRRRLSGAGLPVPNWRLVNTEAELAEFGDQVGWPLVLKTIRGGYDGKGVRVVSGLEAAAEWWAGLGAAEGDGRPALLAEELVRFERELAVLVARSPSGQAAAWPAVQTTQVDGVCREVIAPAPGLAPSRASAATELALRIAGELGVVGVLSVELFDLGSDPTARQGVEPFAGLLVNELAMRPHNAGHWTIDGSVTSQFEQHLRAVLDLPLGAPTCRAPWSVMVNVLGGSDANIYPAYRHVMARDPGAKVHFYGKTVKPGRKIGHVTVSGDDLADCRARAAHAADYLAGTIVE